MLFVADHAVFGDVFLFLCLQPGGEGADVADVFVDGILGFFLCINMILIGLYGIFVDCLHVVSSYAVLIFCPRISGETGGSYSITGHFDEDNREGGIGRNWQSCWQIGNGVFYPYEYFGLKARIALAVFLIGAILPSSVIIR